MRIIGVDEVGRGPLAGPVVAAAVVLPHGYTNHEIKDSKKLSPNQRERIAEVIKRVAIEWSIVAVGPRRIEELNIREASRLAMKLAVERVQGDKALVDGNVPLDLTLPQECIIKGDATIIQISAASIIAKVWRDQLMTRLAVRYPHFGFERHAGYPTAAHLEVLRQHGPSVVHRRSFSGVREFFQVFPDTEQLLC